MRLLSIEWLKIKNYKTFWVLVGLFALFLPLFNSIFSSGIFNSGSGGLPGLSYSFPGVWSSYSYFASIFVMFISFLIIILISNEYSYKTHRQNIIDGHTRLQFFHAKVGLVIMLALFTTVYTAIGAVAFGMIYSTSYAFFTTGMVSLWYFFILCLNYYGLAFMLTLLLKRSGLTIGIFLIYALFIETILSTLFNYYSGGKHLGFYLPLQSSDELLPFPLQRMAGSAMNGGVYPDNGWLLLVSCIYILLYYFISRRRILKSDW